MVEFKHILCPIDFSDTATRALTYAAAFGRWYEAELEVLHVAPHIDDEVAGVQSVLAARPHVSRDAVLAAMQRSVQAAGAAGVRVEMLVDEGHAHETIARRAQAIPADLLVMGTHGRSGFNRLLLGSVTEKVLRSVSCPVLTVPPAAPASAAADVAFRQILCAIDFSPSSLAALRYALELGRQANGCVTALYALEYMDPDEPCEHVDFDIRARRQHFIEHAQARLHAQLANEPATWCEIKETVAIDRAYRAVLQHADASNADLIVMGAQGSGGVELMMYGSNTQHVLRAANRPVLTVHA